MAVDLNARCVRYVLNPRLQIPIGLGRAAATAVASSQSCKGLPVAAHHATWAAARIGGSWAIPGRRAALDVGDEFAEILAELTTRLGGIDGIAVARRRQENRPAYLVQTFNGGRAAAFIKVVPDAEIRGAETERRCLTALAAAPSPLCATPRVLGAGTVGGYQWTAMSVVGTRPHRPAWTADIRAIIRWLQRNLAAVIERPFDCDDDWVPIHGDFVPWNLRRYFRGSTALFDFEDVSWGPADADEVFWHTAVATLRNTPLGVPVTRTTRDWWVQRLNARLADQAVPELDHRLVATLAAATIR